MAMELEPLDVLVARLQGYKAQLLQINQVLALDPTNEQMLKLAADLGTVVEMTNTLIGLHAAPSSSSSSSSSSSGGGNASDDVSSANAGTDDAEDGDDDADDDDDLENATSSVAAATAVVEVKALEADGDSAPRLGPLLVGECIEVTSGARTYAGVITALEDHDGVTARVKYYEFENEVLLPVSDLMRMAPGPLRRSLISAGYRGECKYATDNKYYPCAVEALTPYGCFVKYTQFGNTEEIPIAYLRPPSATIGGVANSSSSSSSSTKYSAGGGKGIGGSTGPSQQEIPIPESLLIKETDTEEEKAKKLKKLKVIKNKNRLVRRDQEQKATQQSWQKFVHKGTKRGYISEQSMFATSEELGGRVGVINSGKAATEYGERKRSFTGAKREGVPDGLHE